MAKTLREEKLISSLLSSKLLQFLFLVLCFSSVLLFYSFAGSRESFLSETNAFKSVIKNQGRVGENPIVSQADKHYEEYMNDFHIFLMFTNVEQHSNLRNKLRSMLDSMFEHAKFDAKQVLHLHFVSDGKSAEVARKEIKKHVENPNVHLQTHIHDVDTYSKQVFPVVQSMQEHFGNHGYYKDAVFFLSIAMHRILPLDIHRVVQLDLDLKITTNIRDIWDEFEFFKHGNIIGLAHELQPVYRHTFWKYRKENPGTKVGNPPPDGITGFNSGVILLDLDAIRESELYNSFLDTDAVSALAEKYHFKGHLGDQDFFTLLSIENGDLFYILDCTWNRQLCQWWKNRGYDDVFDRYYMCDGVVKILHGNCNTAFPDE